MSPKVGSRKYGEWQEKEDSQDSLSPRLIKFDLANVFTIDALNGRGSDTPSRSRDDPLARRIGIQAAPE